MACNVFSRLREMLHSEPIPTTQRPAAPNVRPNIATVSRTPVPVQNLSLDSTITTMVNAAEGVSD